jgi:DNA-binding IclR family transcriptional regulator
VTQKASYSAPAVEKAFAVLDLISHHPNGLRMIDVVERLALPRTSTFVLLRALERMGYLHTDADNRYRLTLKLFSLGMRAMTQSDVVAVARPHLDRLVEQTGLTAHLAALERADAVYLARIDAPGLIRFDTYIGKRTPAHLTAVGKVMLAHLPAGELDELMSAFDLSAGTAKAVHSEKALRRRLVEIQKQGYAFEDGEEVEGVRCVAAPIVCEDARMVASVGIIQVRSMLDDKRVPKVAASVMRTAQEIASEINSWSTAD